MEACYSSIYKPSNINIEAITNSLINTSNNKRIQIFILHGNKSKQRSKSKEGCWPPFSFLHHLSAVCDGAFGHRCWWSWLGFMQNLETKRMTLIVNFKWFRSYELNINHIRFGWFFVREWDCLMIAEKHVLKNRLKKWHWQWLI